MTTRKPKTFKMRLVGGDVLEIEVGTNATQSRDNECDELTYFRLTDLVNSLCWSITLTDNNGKVTTFDNISEIALTLKDEAWAETFIEALRFALYILETQYRDRVTLG